MAPIVHAVGHLKILVSDPDAVIRDATEILGLHVTNRQEGQTWLSSNGRAAELVLLHAGENATHTIGLEALTVEAVRAAEARVAQLGCRIESSQPSLTCMAAGVTFTTPEGLRFEIHTPVKDTIYGRRQPSTGVGANRMDHINLITPDPAATRSQLEGIGGMRLSRPAEWRWCRSGAICSAACPWRTICCSGPICGDPTTRRSPTASRRSSPASRG